MNWEFPTTDTGTYEVRLYFSEPYFGGSGQRIFDVVVEDQTVLNDYDIAADVGPDVGTMQSFTVQSDGIIDIDLVEGPANNPIISGIEIVAVDDTTSSTASTSTLSTTSTTSSDSGSVLTADAGPDQTVAEGETVTLDSFASSYEGDGIVTYSWTQVSGPGVELVGSFGDTPTFTAPDVDVETTLTFRMNATDGELTDSDLVNVTVVPTNDPPVADAGPDLNVTSGETVTFDGTGSSDPNGDSLSYSWVKVAGPAVGTLSGADTATPTLVATDTTEPIMAVYELTVTDGNGGVHVDEINVTVVPAEPSLN
jgi:hypothetical protein